MKVIYQISFAKDPQQGNVLKILEENHYYAFGMKHENYNVTRVNFKRYPDTGVELVPMPAVANASYNYKYNGKELQEELGLNFYDYGNRNYDATIGRFHNMDRFAEKYVDLTSYQYAANNPIVFNDIKGDSIAVASQYREQFTKILESTFGENASKFSYDDNGKLSYSGTKKDFNGDTKEVFNKLNKLMSSKTTTDVLFEEKITVNGTEIDVNVEGGALTLLASENPSMKNNLIAINPKAQPGQM